MDRPNADRVTEGTGTEALRGFDNQEVSHPAWAERVSLNRQQIEGIVHSIRGGAENIEAILPISSLQEGMLLQHMKGSQRDTYFLSMLVELKNGISRQALEAALRSVVGRQEILRSCLLWEGLPQPVQVVLRHCELPVHELTPEPGRSVLQQLREWMSPAHPEKMDLRHAPDRKSTRLNSSHNQRSRMPSSA